MIATELIGLDIGLRHTGIARASSIAKIAEPLKTVNTDNLLDELITLVEEGNTEALAVGLPRNLNGDDTEQTKWIRHFVNYLKSEIKTPMYWVDEALTSKHSTGKDDHAAAAAIILHDFINTPEPQRMAC